MTNKHLLWWVFKWLAERHPLVLADMLKECSGSFGDGAAATVNEQLNEAFNRYRASIE